MTTEQNKCIFSVHLAARVIDRNSGEEYLGEEVHCSIETPSLYYYEADAERLRSQILHLARVRYVYAVQAMMERDASLARKLAKRDWMVDVDESHCRITPEPTEECRRRILTFLKGGMYATLTANESLRA